MTAGSFCVYYLHTLGLSRCHHFLRAIFMKLEKNSVWCPERSQISSSWNASSEDLSWFFSSIFFGLLLGSIRCPSRDMMDVSFDQYYAKIQGCIYSCASVKYWFLGESADDQLIIILERISPVLKRNLYRCWCGTWTFWCPASRPWEGREASHNAEWTVQAIRESLQVAHLPARLFGVCSLFLTVFVVQILL